MAGLPSPVSFVPPRHSLPEYDVLRDYGIEIIRVPENNEPRTKAHRLVRILRGDQPIVEPRLVDGLVESYVTERISLATPLLPSGQRLPHPLFRRVPLAVRRRLHRRTLERTVRRVEESGSHVHVWAHLWDIANDYQWPQIEAFIELLARRQETDDLTVLPLCRLIGNVGDGKPPGDATHERRQEHTKGRGP